MKQLIVAASTQANRPTGSDAQKVGDFYLAYMDTSRVGKPRDLAPLKDELARIDAIATPRDVARYIGYSQRIGVAQPFAWFSASRQQELHGVPRRALPERAHHARP